MRENRHQLWRIVSAMITVSFGLAAVAIVPLQALPDTQDADPKVTTQEKTDESSDKAAPLVLTPLKPVDGKRILPEKGILSWQYGDETDQYYYDIRIADTSEVDKTTGELLDPDSKENSLKTAEFDATELTTAGEDKTYYWQVRFCNMLLLTECGEWSDVWHFVTDSVAPTAPTLRVTSETFNATPTFAGEAEKDSTITVKIGELECEATVDSEGSWQCQITDELPYNDYVASVTARDAAGNISEPTSITVALFPLVVITAVKPIAVPMVVAESEQQKAVREATANVIQSYRPTHDAPLDVAEKSQNPVSDVLGVSATDTAVQASPSGWMLLGVAWYWWLAAFICAFVVRQIMAYRSKRIFVSA